MYRIIGADGQQYGPVSLDQLQQWIAAGRVNAETLVRAESIGGAEWKRLADLPELRTLSNAGAAPPLTPPPPFPVIAANPASSGIAVAGLVMGILTCTFGMCCGGPLFAILGIIFSSVGISKINKSAGRLGGKGMAVAGLILSVVGLLVNIIAIVLFGMMGVWKQILNQGHF